jgi:hypothetical protein
MVRVNTIFQYITSPGGLTFQGAKIKKRHKAINLMTQKPKPVRLNRDIGFTTGGYTYFLICNNSAGVILVIK